jgi:hypothetical protein
MANSKHAHIRYNILGYCFRNKSFSFNDLLSFVNDKIAELYPGEGISIRTLRDDIKVFRDKKEGFGAPLPENIRILRYEDPNFSIAQKPLLVTVKFYQQAIVSLLIGNNDMHLKNFSVIAKAIANLWKRTQKGILNWGELIINSFLSDENKNALKELIENRAKQLEIHIG